ncbi:uncharacterized protein LOC128135727 [Harpia harpyja]|uniref:uncharacterized protein LOC128135727 n=1 Tax=Harpia harpyja TaxID=202280 RepID=UPI0022B0DB52|nr:uncharacterized protein LOC128135727 [Harpia harpyja]
MQRLFSCCLGRVRRPPPSDGDAGPCAAEPSEVREKPRGGLHGAAAGGDLARLQRHWWRKRFRINRRDAEKHRIAKLQRKRRPSCGFHLYADVKHGCSVLQRRAATVSAPEREELQLKKDASCQTDLQGDRQTWVKQPWQELANPLKRSSLTEASPEAVKCYSVYLQEQKLQLQKKLYRSKAKLQELKERHTRTECYAEYLKDAIRRNERELTSRNLQDLLTTSSGTAAIPELEDHIRRLQGEKARLETTVQQQAKTIEALWKKLQACALSHNGLEDSVTGFRTTRTAKEHRRRQRGSESKEVKKLGKTQCRSEALPDEAWKRNAALEEEQTRHGFLVEDASADVFDNPDCVCSAKEKVPAQFLARDEVTNAVSMAPHLTDFQSQLNLQRG